MGGVLGVSLPGRRLVQGPRLGEGARTGAPAQLWEVRWGDRWELWADVGPHRDPVPGEKQGILFGSGDELYLSVG